MCITDFENLPLDVKTSYIWDYGTCLHQKLERGTGILCIFHVDGFFVEARYAMSDNGINTIKPLKEYCRWELYVDRMLKAHLAVS